MGAMNLSQLMIILSDLNAIQVSGDVGYQTLIKKKIRNFILTTFFLLALL